MKLSILDTNGVADILVQLAPDIEALMNDTELASIIKNRKQTSDENEATTLGMVTVLSVAVYLLKNQRLVTWNMLGSLNGKTANEIGKQLFPVTLKQIVEVLNDKDLIGFFTSFAPPEQEQSSASSPE